MGRIADEQGEAAFPRPAGIEERVICVQTGLLAGARCDSVVAEVFLRDTAPTTTCNGLHDSRRRPPPDGTQPDDEIEGF
jgi:hypothetical protein